jgi:hypothetical protein
MYTEHVGSKRHETGRHGDMKRLYPLSILRMKAFMSVFCNTRQKPEPPRTSVPEKQDFNCRCGLQQLPAANIFGPGNSLHHCQKFRPELSVSGFGTTTLGVENNVE